MIIYAITFLANKNAEKKLTSWLINDAIPALNVSVEASPRLTKVVAVPDDPDFSRQALSMTLHVNFSSPALAKAWGKEDLPPVINEFSRLFGPDALNFISILRDIPIS
ncbi:MAG: DUF4286 family protein [Prevotella sp.]|nr:DUF4286 family protein [Prevotella sp.]MCM1476212.1 DUF4286 family protein [Muribaculaceae bacterium]